MIYFIQAGENGPIKIGYTEKPIKERLSQLQMANHLELKLLWHIKGSLEKEKIIHNHFKEERLRGEWFNPAKKILTFINNICSYFYEVNLINGHQIKISVGRKIIIISGDGWVTTIEKINNVWIKKSC
jgi:hypothetical protein